MSEQTCIYPDHPHKGMTIGALLIRRDAQGGGINFYWNRHFKFYVGTYNVMWVWRNKRYVILKFQDRCYRWHLGGMVDGARWFYFPKDRAK